MKNGNLPASPLTGNAYEIFEAKNESGHPSYDAHCLGLTKREDFAKFALKGLLVNAGRNGLEFTDCAAEAVRQADALLAELEKQNEA